MGPSLQQQSLQRSQKSRDQRPNNLHGFEFLLLSSLAQLNAPGEEPVRSSHDTHLTVYRLLSEVWTSCFLRELMLCVGQGAVCSVPDRDVQPCRGLREQPLHLGFFTHGVVGRNQGQPRREANTSCSWTEKTGRF